jgi:DNA-binding GntR family transcriptional regulator
MRESVKQKLAPKAEPLRNQVIATIRNGIFSGQFLPGETIREMQLAEDEGVSQAIIREALLALEHTGLVVRTPNVGTTVTKLAVRDIRERVAIRIVLEGMAGREAAQHVGAVEVKELRRRLADLNSATERNMYFEAAQADLEFHRLIWKLSGNERLAKVLDDVTTPLFAFISIRRRLSLENLKTETRSHDPIFKALQSRDCEAVEIAIREHIELSYGRYLDSEPEQRATAARPNAH